MSDWGSRTRVQYLSKILYSSTTFSTQIEPSINTKCTGYYNLVDSTKIIWESTYDLSKFILGEVILTSVLLADECTTVPNKQQVEDQSINFSTSTSTQAARNDEPR